MTFVSVAPMGDVGVLTTRPLLVGGFSTQKRQEPDSLFKRDPVSEVKI